MEKNDMIVSCRIVVQGLVQGVGFRPHVHRLALENELTGTVRNRNNGVEIVVDGTRSSISSFLDALEKRAPEKARLDSVLKRESIPCGFTEFSIAPSAALSDEITRVSPDIAVCSACMADREVQPHRINYPFINCTDCGPRFSIISQLPYDRVNTSMNRFQMCESCQTEFETLSNRRYHAQPIGCNHCGPQYRLISSLGEITEYRKILFEVQKLLADGGIIAIKGVGGFHLACDALNSGVIHQLRMKKRKYDKPFAVMFPDIESIKPYAFFNNYEKELLESWRRPVVILELKKELSREITKGLNSMGVFLPYMPFHYDLFRIFKHPIVLTSGNLSGEPISIENPHAMERLGEVTSHFLVHNRSILNRVDDSVAMVVNRKTRVIRRARGFCPEPIVTSLNVDGILAAGAELSASFAIGKNNMIIPGQYIGDLKDYATFRFYDDAIHRYKRLFRFSPQLVAHDLHPDYLSTRYARGTTLPLMGVQHHHAHIASCMAEYNLDEQVIGVAFDGTGYGTDGLIWGSEFMVADLAGFRRVNYFEPLSLPGGDAVVKEPWRMALSLLFRYYGPGFRNMNLPFLKNLSDNQVTTVIQALTRKINCPASTSAGRVFDAVAALTGLCLSSTFHARAPMMLESVIHPGIDSFYPFSGTHPISLRPLLDGITRDISQKVPASVISARFHNTIIQIVVSQVNEMSVTYGIDKVILSGGCFQNAYILGKLEKRLMEAQLKVYAPSLIPANDMGIALGQIMVAAKRRTLCA